MGFRAEQYGIGLPIGLHMHVCDRRNIVICRFANFDHLSLVDTAAKLLCVDLKGPRYLTGGSGATILMRRATRDDVPRIMQIRAGVRENRLRDPSRVTVEDVFWFVDNPGIFLWEEDSSVVGFSASDPRNGNIFALFVEERYERRGIGQALFECACKVLVDAGCSRMWLTTWPGTRAERFYRKAGWRVTGMHNGNLVFEK